jgi:hypothetical protein
MTDTDEPMAYAGHCPTCDALCAAAVDEPRRARENAKFVAQMIRDGLRIERIDCAAVRGGKWCKCPRPGRKRSAKATEQVALNV